MATKDRVNFEIELCKALGLRPEQVMSLEFRLRVGEPIFVVATLLVMNDKTKDLAEVFEKYQFDIKEKGK